MKKKTKKYKYHVHRAQCVICSHEVVYRERVYGAKKTERTYADTACDDHFL